MDARTLAIALLVAAPLAACGPTEFRGTYIEFEVFAGDAEKGETPMRTGRVERDEPIHFSSGSDHGERYSVWIEKNVRLGFPEPTPDTYRGENAVIGVWDEQNHGPVGYDRGDVYCVCADDEKKLSADEDSCTWTELTIERKDYGLVWGNFSASLCGDGEEVKRVEVIGQFAAATTKE